MGAPDAVPLPGPADPLRVAVVTESFLPTLNGVTTSVCRVLEHLAARGHETLVVCPGPAPAEFAGARVVTVPALSYRQFPVGVPTRTLRSALADFDADVVHLASPFVLGARGVQVARRLGVPTVAIFQTDIPGFARSHHLGALSPVAWRWIRGLHERADVTLAPSSATMADLARHGVPRLGLWRRGVDGARFHPARRARPEVAALRARLAPDGEVLAGYIGRLAPEKHVHRLAALAGMPGVRLAIGGDGPARRGVESALGDDATFLGQLDGDPLADTFAALDVFVHTGTEETFGQTIQEALASGVPVVAPACGGPLDLVRPGENGILYPPGDEAALRAAVAGLAADPDLRARMSLAARAGVAGRTWEALGDQLVGHYRAAVAESGAPARHGRTRRRDRTARSEAA
jgi:phosphatidylinositol alpha 1,6-mannosyltransferase